MKKQYFFSFVLALLSIVAAKSIEEIGIKTNYKKKATSFLKEDGYVKQLLFSNGEQQKDKIHYNIKVP